MTQETSKVLNNETLSKSQKMIQLYDAGMEIKNIAELMGVRYNFVYNVVSNHTRKNGLELRTNKNDNTIKSQIIDLHKAGKTKVEIARELKTNYNYVFNTVKQYELTAK